VSTQTEGELCYEVVFISGNRIWGYIRGIVFSVTCKWPRKLPFTFKFVAVIFYVKMNGDLVCYNIKYLWTTWMVTAVAHKYYFYLLELISKCYATHSNHFCTNKINLITVSNLPPTLSFVRCGKYENHTRVSGSWPWLCSASTLNSQWDLISDYIWVCLAIHSTYNA